MLLFPPLLYASFKSLYESSILFLLPSKASWPLGSRWELPFIICFPTSLRPSGNNKRAEFLLQYILGSLGLPISSKTAAFSACSSITSVCSSIASPMLSTVPPADSIISVPIMWLFILLFRDSTCPSKSSICSSLGSIKSL